MCEACGSKQFLQGHHLRYRNLTDCTAEDIMVLCEQCHTRWHLYFNSHVDRSRGFVIGFLAGVSTKRKERKARVQKRSEYPKYESLTIREGEPSKKSDPRKWRAYLLKINAMPEGFETLEWDEVKRYLRTRFAEHRNKHRFMCAARSIFDKARRGTRN